ncbi:MAG: hypothetical protein ACRC92_15860, partial [Peptostreptococcaceae bacterium]
IKTVEGDIGELENVSLVYTPAIKDLKKEEIVISKDGVKSIIKSDHTIGRDFIKTSSDDNDILKFEYVERIYENEDYIGTIDISDNSYFMQDNLGARAFVKEKNKNTGEIKEYTIPVTFKENKEEFYISAFYSTKYEDSVYTVGFDYNEGIDKVYIFKTDLKNQTSEIVVEKNGFEETQEGGFKFTLDNKIYIELTNYSSIPKTNFLIYDMEKNTLSESNEFMNDEDDNKILLDKVILDYNLTGNKLNVLAADYNSKPGKRNVITKFIYNVDNENITLDSYFDYNLDTAFSGNISGDFSGNGINYGENGRVLGIKKVKMVDDKIYSIYQNTGTLNRKAENGQRVIVQGNKPVELSVFDTTKNKIVYKGEITTGDKEVASKLFLVKNY